MNIFEFVNLFYGYVLPIAMILNIIFAICGIVYLIKKIKALKPKKFDNTKYVDYLGDDNT